MSKPAAIKDHYAVVVIGGGPTGLTIANLLGRYGTPTLLVERNASTVGEPRAVSIDDESLRTMQAVGVLDEVMLRVEAGYGSEYYSPSGKLFLKVEPSEQPYGHPRRNAFRQPILEAQLRNHLDTAACVDTMFEWTLTAIEQDDSAATLTLSGPGGATRTVTCDYLVGADGASSTVRGLLGLSLDGETFREKWLIVDLEDSPAPSRNTIVFCDIRRPCIALPGPNRTRRFEFKLLPGENPDRMTDEAVVADLLQSHGTAPGSRIVRKTVYTFHARVAPCWSRGRVFLAGDACHLTPPFAGQGMNSGIRDAHNLAWKLHWVTSGLMPASLLDSYERERKEHVRDMINLALRMGRIMGPRSALNGWLTQSMFRTLNYWPTARDYLAQMKYKPKPRFADGFILSDNASSRHTAVGRLVPQPKVTLPSGEEILLDTLLGDGFALLCVTDDVTALEAARQAIESAGIPVRAIAVASGQAQPSEKAQGLPHDHSGALLNAVQGQRNVVMVVRPDRYVFGTFPLGTEAAFTERLAEAVRTADGWQAPHHRAAA